MLPAHADRASPFPVTAVDNVFNRCSGQVWIRIWRQVIPTSSASVPPTKAIHRKDSLGFLRMLVAVGQLDLRL